MFLAHLALGFLLVLPFVVFGIGHMKNAHDRPNRRAVKVGYLLFGTSLVVLVTGLLPFRVSDVVIAFAPGAQDPMMVLALALHLDPDYVGAHHLMRFLVVTFSVAIAARRLAHRPGMRPRERRKPSGKGTFVD